MKIIHERVRVLNFIPFSVVIISHFLFVEYIYIFKEQSGLKENLI